MVVNFTMLDRTSPVRVTLWGDVAEQAMRHMGQSADGTPVVLLISGFRSNVLTRNAFYGNIVTQMVEITSVDAGCDGGGTTVESVLTPQSPFNHESVSFKVPTHPVVMKHFVMLKHQCDSFRGSFLGTVVDVDDPDFTVSGQDKRGFNLVDDTGAWFPCFAVGRNARIIPACSNMKVVLFFGTGRVDGQSTSFTVWASADAVIICLGTNEVRVTKREDVSARDQPTRML